MTDSWFPYGGGSSSAHLRLFCFHHAGGGASAFLDWRRRLPAEVDVLAAQLPGREQRLDEAPLRGMAVIGEALAAAMAPYLDRPYALFGHSLGGAVAFALATRLVPPPVHLFISSWVPPGGEPPRRPIAALPDGEFVAAMGRYGGIPAALLHDADIMRELLRPMRADVEVLESYRPAVPGRLPCPATVLGGRDDPVATPAALARWSACVDAAGPRLFPGGHFYLRQCLPAVIETVRAALPAPAA